MLALFLAAVVAQAPPPKPTQVKPRPAAQKAAMSQQDAQEKAVIARRRAKQWAKNRDLAISGEKAAIQAAKDYAEYQRALAAQQEYEIRMGPIWAAEHANLIQQQRNALMAQRNAIEQQKVVGVNPVSHLCGAYTGNPTGIYCTNRVSGSTGFCNLHQ